MQRAASALLFSGKDNEGHEAMDADGLQRGFQLGEWRVTPADSTIAGQSGTRTLQPANLQLLLALAAHRGEAIDKDIAGDGSGTGRYTDRAQVCGTRGARRRFAERERSPENPMSEAQKTEEGSPP